MENLFPLIWVPLGVLAAMFWAWSFIINHYVKAPGLALLFWRGALPIAVFLPLSLLVGLPATIMFYVAAVGGAIAAGVTDVILQNAVAKFGGGTVSRLVPVNVAVVFWLYFLVQPQLLKHYLQSPFVFSGVIIGLVGTIYFASRLRHNQVTRDAAIFLLPALLSGSLVFVFAKLAFNNSSLHQGVYAYMLVQSMLMAPVSLLAGKALGYNLKSEVFGGRAMLGGALFAIATVFYVIPANYAMSLAPHPAYLNALLLTQALFVYLFFRLRGEGQGTDVKAGLLMVACIGAMLVFSAFL